VEVRSYGQYCPVARATEILAMRWTPIIVRNLLLGCETFSELMDGAPGIPRTLLSRRLELLEQYGVVERRPGGRGSRYLLTEAGRELESVIDAMGTWGARRLEAAPAHFDYHTVLWSLCRLTDSADLPGRRLVIRFELRDGAQRRVWVRPLPTRLRGVREAAGIRRGPGRDHNLRVAGEVAHGPDLARTGDVRGADRGPGPV
jgi:DNA-binding HxlR family transcriptional regulator